MSNWEGLVEVLHMVFRDIRLPMECKWQTVVTILNGDRDFRVIGLVEILCKAFSGVINQRIRVALQFHDVLHGL